ncbi:BspA family leucine-rich repeat surface protein [Candidatus Haliotispira prima]|uniref:BspA family leucine-rich repeat surface protein n=1 Tax=Candidatus Haliotispira prima TaxID=3034016 RepID=A0ABY8MKP3_9SPIO|nr:BspA family leucine-rich repeat surface protein [Candidatus Haliotispira prima]
MFGRPYSQHDRDVGPSSFNQAIEDWDVSNVTDMTAMFSGALIFNQAIRDWDVSNVTGMTRMFYGAKAFDQDISGWAVQPSDEPGL